MRKLLFTISFILFTSLVFSTTCIEDNRTITERLFQNNTGTIFTCEILTYTKPDSYIEYKDIGVKLYKENVIASATARIITVYFGEVDTNIVSLKTSSNLKIGEKYLIYTYGQGREFSFGGICDIWSKQLKDNPEIKNELLILQQFSEIFKKKESGKFIFKNSHNDIISIGSYKKGKPTKVWKHFYDNGIIKAEYNLTKNITSQYFKSGYIKSRSTIKRNIRFYEKFLDKINGQLKFTNREVEKDTSSIMTVTEYYDNGQMKKLSSQVNINHYGGSYSTGKTGVYKEFHENGILKVQGQYQTNKPIGLWKWYNENGKLHKKFDYKNGTDGK